MGNNRRVNLFIVGAMKAGTTSFSNAIAQHPAIYFSPIKEPNFFIDEMPGKIYTPSKYFSLDKYFEKEFPKPLHIAQVRDMFQYEQLFSLANPNHTFLAEGSTTYLHAPETAKKLYAYNPDSKIIILIRNGLSRALSHYKMDVGLGRVTKSFEAVITQNMEAYKNGTTDRWSYIGMSLYAENICRFKKLFKDQVLVIRLEDMLNKEETMLQQVFSFLGLSHHNIQLSRSNESFNIRFSKPLSWLYKTGVKDFLSHVLPVKLRHAAFNVLKRQPSVNDELPPGLKTELLDLFQEDINKINDSTLKAFIS